MIADLVVLNYGLLSAIIMTIINHTSSIFQYLEYMTNMLLFGQKKEGPDAPKSDFPPVVKKSPLPLSADPEDPLESEAGDIILPDETTGLLSSDEEPPAPGEGP